ncbi:hypothetical protein EGW08_020016 [Elysia chlorotica]|uniref:Uncharacterized protein n=1 Tax=Elysia chlorotica TaxID=188477 RepID=A0A433SSU5_ELYCH|nr:hypothetical protein EGW08_020016 [Elysia chlorotica]
MECICLKRKHRKPREQRKFRPLSPGVSPAHSQPSTFSPAHSQPSTLGHTVPDGRLPKVNSTGLWMGAPSLYSGSPSQAYYYGRPSSQVLRDERPVHIPRAASETRISQPGSASETRISQPSKYINVCVRNSDLSAK